MEILGCAVSPWLLWPALFFALLCVYTLYRRLLFMRLGFPCARSWPFLGDLPSVIKHGMAVHHITQMRENGKLFGNFSGNIFSLVVADTDIIKQIFVKDFSSFPQRAALFDFPKHLGLSVSNATGEHWKYLRNTLSPTYSTGKLKDMTPLIHACLENCVNCVEQKLEVSDTIDLQATFGALTMDVICRTSIGIEVDSQNNPDNSFVKYAKRVMDLSAGSLPILLAFFFPEAKFLLKRLGVTICDQDALDFYAAACREAMSARREAGPTGHWHKDALQLMLNACQEQTEKDDGSREQGEDEMRRSLTDDEIIANTLAFLLAGYDTTSTALTWIVYCLATNPDVQERLQEEIESELGSRLPDYDAIAKMQYLDMVVCETLRHYPPSLFTNRETVRDTEIRGHKLPRGTMVSLRIYGIHHMEEYWPNPDKFDPERFSPENKVNIDPYSYLPFGIGPRQCIGMRLALMETKMAIVTFLQHFRVSPSAETEIPAKLAKGVFLKPANGMKLKVERRNK